MGGLGATKVKTNFADVEARANAANESKTLAAASAGPVEKPQTAEEELETVASMRLAYQDLSLQKNREEAKLKNIDPAKAKQMERLGMGFNLRGSDVAHSAISDMETIQQAAAPKSSSQSKLAAIENESFFNDHSLSLYGGGGDKKDISSSSKLDKYELDALGYETIEPIGGTHSNITSMFAASSDYDKPKATVGSRSTVNKSKNTVNSLDPVAAQQKFGNAKGFGSDQFFANEQSSADISANLNRFQGSRAISSSDYFNEGTSGGGLSNRSSKNNLPLVLL